MKVSGPSPTFPLSRVGPGSGFPSDALRVEIGMGPVVFPLPKANRAFTLLVFMIWLFSVAET